MNDLERELWNKMEEAIGIDEDLDLFEILKTMYNGTLEQMERDDYILSLSGLDDDAEDRIVRRRELMKHIEEVRIKREKEKKDSLKRWKEGQKKRGGK